MKHSRISMLALAAFAWRKPIIAAAKKVIGLIW